MPGIDEWLAARLTWYHETGKEKWTGNSRLHDRVAAAGEAAGSGPAHGVQVTRALEAAQIVLTPVLEVQAGVSGQFPGGRRHEDLTGTSRGQDSSRLVDREAMDICIGHLDLARVHRRPGRQPQVPGRLSQGNRASDCPAGTVECGEDPIAGLFHLTTAESSQGVLHPLLVRSDEVTPRMSAHTAGGPGGIDDVDEYERCQHSLGEDPREGIQLRAKKDGVIAVGDKLDGTTVIDLRFCEEGRNDSGQIAFIATLEDPDAPNQIGFRTAVFSATPRLK